MKKAFVILFFALFALSGYCDVIFTPLQNNFLSYSGELIFSVENVKKAKSTSCYWGGLGFVGSLYHSGQPTFGLEIAVEKRYYFKPDYFKHFFVSGYLGIAYMTNSERDSFIGLIPGLKINYKAQLSQKLFLEPYVSLSVPLISDVQFQHVFVPIPIVTIGARFGFSIFKNKISTKT
jgi:hypothetical protein